jgi:hypothetical protein
LRDNPHLEFKRLPSYSPRLNPIERFWKKLRRRATHNRLFDTLADLKASLRASLCYFQTMRPKVKSILQGRPRKKTAANRQRIVSSVTSRFRRRITALNVCGNRQRPRG